MSLYHKLSKPAVSFVPIKERDRRHFGDGLFDKLMAVALVYKNDVRYNIA